MILRKLVEWLADNGFYKAARFICGRLLGHKPVWFNVGGIEPDMTCAHCGEIS